MNKSTSAAGRSEAAMTTSPKLRERTPFRCWPARQVILGDPGSGSDAPPVPGPGGTTHKSGSAWQFEGRSIARAGGAGVTPTNSSLATSSICWSLSSTACRTTWVWRSGKRFLKEF